MVVALWCIGCGRQGSVKAGASPEPPSTPPTAQPAPGRFVAEYGPADPEFTDFRAGLVANRFLDTIAGRLNDSLVIPADVTLRTAHCTDPNASYEPATRTVTLCYELFKFLSERFSGEEGGGFLVTGTVVFALMHELGHALVDVLDIPITGREEDAADQLATYLLLNQGATGDTLAFGAVGWFATHAATAQLSRFAFADATAWTSNGCTTSCADPRQGSRPVPRIVAEDWLPEERRARCPAEYRRFSSSWQRLLAPHRRPPA
jgi:hypothetical protein